MRSFFGESHLLLVIRGVVSSLLELLAFLEIEVVEMIRCLGSSLSLSLSSCGSFFLGNFAHLLMVDLLSWYLSFFFFHISIDCWLVLLELIVGIFSQTLSSDGIVSSSLCPQFLQVWISQMRLRYFFSLKHILVLFVFVFSFLSTLSFSSFIFLFFDKPVSWVTFESKPIVWVLQILLILLLRRWDHMLSLNLLIQVTRKILLHLILIISISLILRFHLFLLDLSMLEITLIVFLSFPILQIFPLALSRRWSPLCSHGILLRIFICLILSISCLDLISHLNSELSIFTPCILLLLQLSLDHLLIVFDIWIVLGQRSVHFSVGNRDLAFVPWGLAVKCLLMRSMWMGESTWWMRIHVSMDIAVTGCAVSRWLKRHLFDFWSLGSGRLVVDGSIPAEESRDSRWTDAVGGTSGLRS